MEVKNVSSTCELKTINILFIFMTSRAAVAAALFAFYLLER